MNCPKCGSDRSYIEFDDGKSINAIYKCHACAKQFFGPVGRSAGNHKDIRLDWMAENAE